MVGRIDALESAQGETHAAILETRDAILTDLRDLRVSLWGNGKTTPDGKQAGVLPAIERRLSAGEEWRRFREQMETLTAQPAQVRDAMDARFDALERLVERQTQTTSEVIINTGEAHDPPKSTAATVVNRETLPWLVLALSILLLAGVLGVSIEWPW
jgi:hypothetical protein